jgi:two-component system, OmpR family, response regulator
MLPFSDLPDPAAAPRILVADDDPASRCYLGDGLRGLGVAVETCVDGMEAIALGRAAVFHLLVLDCHMPGADAEQVLASLRDDPQARSADSLAVASSAELSIADRQRLLAAGFSDVLLKPCALADLQRLVQLVQPDRAPLLDDQQALASTGSPAIMHALRGLLHDELVSIERDLDRLGADPGGLGDRLHRLRSSCGFCGASSLAEQIVRLQRHIELGHRGHLLPLAGFRRTLQSTIQALGTS